MISDTKTETKEFKDCTENNLDNQYSLTNKQYFVGTFLDVSQVEIGNGIISFNKLVKKYNIKKLQKTYFVSKGEKARKKRYRKRIIISKQNKRKTSTKFAY